MNPKYAPHTLTSLVLHWVGVIAVPVLGYSPFHLLWWFPAALLVSFVVAGIFYHITGGGRELRKRKHATYSKKPDESARRIREEQDRKRREQFEQELFSFLEMACEDAEKKVTIRFYKNLEEYSGIVAMFLFTAWLCLYKHIEAFIIIGIVLALVWLSHLISSKIAKNKFIHLEKIVSSTMEELVSPIVWQEHKGRCVDKLYEKYTMDENMRRAIRLYRKSH